MPRKSPWANLTPEQYEAWCDSISAGRKAAWDDPKKRASYIASTGRVDHSQCEHDASRRARRRCRNAHLRAAAEADQS